MTELKGMRKPITINLSEDEARLLLAVETQCNVSRREIFIEGLKSLNKSIDNG